jgi:predicted small secreted protein
MRKGFLALFFIFVFLAFSLSGCNYFGAKKEIANAEKLLSDLKGAGGEKKVPYEYCSAENFLEASKLEFSHNHFGPSKGLAQRSTSAARVGLDEVKRK